MVIAPGNKPGITALVILADGEFLPKNLNNEKILVFRQGNSTGRELKLVKPLGALADASLLRDKPNTPVCNFSGGQNPLHQHDDSTWWFYEETWNFENGPFETYDEGYAALGEYCEAIQAVREENDLTNEENRVKVVDDETPETNSARVDDSSGS